jgi:orotate phosphoribosyltransferase
MNFEQALIDNEIVILSPNDLFTWASGIKSPIYCDNRMILSNVQLRNYVIDKLVEMVGLYYPNVDAILGTSTAGIPHGTLVADRMRLPVGYVRGGAKKHGRGKQVEGVCVAGLNVVVIEDLISTGGSVLEVVDVLRANGANVLGVCGIFTYELQKADVVLKNVDYHTISSISKLLNHVETTNSLDFEQINVVKRFLDEL